MSAKTLDAKIIFLSADEGGRITPPQSGIRPQLKLGEVFTSCIVASKAPTQTFEFGTEYEVKIEVMFWEEYGSLFHDDEPVQLFDGSRLIARGFWATRA